MTAVLCIGGLDPAGRAGLLADARAVTARGAWPICVATALTFQSSRRVAGYEAVSPEALEKQLLAVLEDEPIAAVKIGQLASAENAAVIARLLPDVPIVLDTPLVSSSGAALFPPAEIVAAYRPLLAKATLVTPNAEEVSLLAGADLMGAPAVLLKGGHLPGDVVEDVLFVRGERRASYRSARLPGRFRGTGCRLASAVAADLAQGAVLPDAIRQARGWLMRELAAEL